MDDKKFQLPSVSKKFQENFMDTDDDCEDINLK